MGGARELVVPQPLENYLRRVVRLSADERAALDGGSAITRLLDADASKEVAVFGAIWIPAPPSRYVAAVSDIEEFESGGGFRVTRRVSEPPRLEDFAELRLPDEDLADLRGCRVGDCEIKLGERPLQALRAEVNWDGPTPWNDANAVMRRFMLEYATGYLAGGNDRLAVYRDQSRPRFVAQELHSMIGGMPSLTTHWTGVRRYLRDFPRATIPGGKSFLYWQEAQFGLKPTIRLNHVVIREGPADTVIASKLLYASHYFWTAVELRILTPDPSRGPGFWFMTINRSRSDGLSGFSGMFVRRRVRGEALAATLATLESTRRKMEEAER